MESIKNRTLYINLTTQNKQHEVREARIITLISTFESIHWDGRVNPMVKYVKPTELKLEIAGMGVLGMCQIDAICGVLYLTEEDACAQTSNHIYKYNWENFKLEWAGITLDDLSLRNNKFSLVNSNDFCYLSYQVMSWYWNGTKACAKHFLGKFKYDFANNIIVEYSDVESDYNKYKLYATKEMCENDNKPIIVTFAEEKKPTTKRVVTFEIKAVVEVEEDEDYDVIVETAVKQIKNAPNKTLCETYTSIQ